MARRHDRVLGIAIVAIFFLSGFSALIYQIVWMRMLTHVFGASVFAMSTVVTVFMAGLAVGSYVIGRWIDRSGQQINCLRLYALIESVIGLYCFLTPWLFTHLDIVYDQIYDLIGLNFYLFSLVRFCLIFLVLIFPTILMGATLPVIAKYFVDHESDIGRHVGMLYGMNTLGAVTGVLLSAYVLIPYLGLRLSLLLAVFINFLIALVAFTVKGRLGYVLFPEQPLKVSVQPDNECLPAPMTNEVKAVMWVFGLSGFIALAYEVVWFRILGMTIGSTAYAFATMLAVFLVGLAVGSTVMSRFVERIHDKIQAFALLELALGASVLLLTPLLGKLPLLFLGLLSALGFEFWAQQAIHFVTATVAMLLPTLLMGAIFPLAVRLVTPERQCLGQRVGMLYAVNTIGAALGALMAGFVLLPWLGIKVSIASLAMFNIVLGCVLVLVSEATTIRLRYIVLSFAAVLLVFSLVQSPWDKRLLSSGLYFNAFSYYDSYQQGKLDELLDRERHLVYYNEGLTGTVSVNRFHNYTDLAINGKITASVPNDVFTNTMVGALPLLLHESPKETLLVGLASGVTLGVMERFPVKLIDVVEISPEVVEASQFFNHFNHNALQDKRVHLTIDDGRTYLAYADKKYDVIVSMPQAPVSSSVANLFTREFYQIMKGRLREGGVVGQWMHSYGMTQEDLRTVLRSFKNVFPQAMLWQYDVENMLLIGSLEPIVIDYDRINTLLHDVAIGPVLAREGIVSVESVVGGLMLTSSALQSFVGVGADNTDDKPILEFNFPRHIFESMEADNYYQIAQQQPLLRPNVHYELHDDEVYYPFLQLRVSLAAGWRPQYAGFNVVSRGVVAPKNGRTPLVKKGVMALAEWHHTQEDYWLRLRAYKLAAHDMSLKQQRHLLGGLVDGEPKLRGEMVVGGRTFLWEMYKKEVPVLLFDWSCPANEKIYFGEVLYPPNDQSSLATLMDELAHNIHCM